MNLCTDQLAMLIAAEGQLHSVSYLASDASSSVFASSAGKYAVNHGLAEEVFLMKPDLVIAGTYSTRATVALLRRLGIRVEEFAPEQSFDDVRNNIMRMGDLLDRRERASELVDHLDRQLAELDGQGKSGRTVATYYANSYTSGSGTLVDAAIQASGLTNMAASLGLAGTARLPLEVLVLSRPDLLVDGEARYTAPALANENFTHPAYRALAKETASVAVPAKYTICGAPFTAEAARLMRDAADAAAPGNPK
jgi:iron complex transport system substrate-binding protein